MQPLRIPGTGCASQVDIDYCWPAIQAAVLRDMVLRHNRRPDGRGLHDLRTNNYEVGNPPSSSFVSGQGLHALGTNGYEAGMFQVCVCCMSVVLPQRAF